MILIKERSPEGAVGAIFRARARLTASNLLAYSSTLEKDVAIQWASNLSKTQVHAGNPSILLGYTCIYSIKTSMPVAAMTVDFHLMCCFQERSRIHSYPRETLARGN